MYVCNSRRGRDGRLTLFYRPNKLFACYVSLFGVSSRSRRLTVSALRLNSRDYISDRPTTNADMAYNLSSIRIEPPSEAYMSKSEQPGVSVTVHRSTTSNYGLDKSDNDGESTFKIRKPVRSLHLFVTPGLMVKLSAGCKYHPLSKRRSNVGIKRLRS
jgi:hypothetical protein